MADGHAMNLFMRKTIKKPLRPINEWVRKALDHTDLSDAEVARRLHARGLIGTPDRSVPGKMATDRDVKAAEMVALSEITGYPPLKGTISLDDRDAVLALLSSIEDLPSDSHEVIYAFMLGRANKTVGSQQSDQPHGQSEQTNRPRGSAPSDKLVRPFSS